MSFRKWSIAAAIVSLVLVPAVASAATKHKTRTTMTRTHASGQVHTNRHVNRTVTHRTTVSRSARVNRNVHVNRNVNVNVRVGGRYHGGVWYGHRRHYWQGRWYAYGIGPCWLATPIGYVWTCG